MKTLCLVVLVGFGPSALAQEAASPPQGDIEEIVIPGRVPENLRVEIEEIIIPGRVPENLRVEIERLEVAVYEQFNALNSSDEFDIHCLLQARTGTNIPQRTCVPNFVIQVESRSAKKLLTDGRGSSANNANSGEHSIWMEQKSRELTEEMQRIARENERFMRYLVRLDELRQMQSPDQGQPSER